MGRVHLAVSLILLGLTLSAAPAHAGGAVSVCDEAHLKTALAGGGTVTFTCSGTITLTSSITISANTTIDGSGQTVTISGDGKVRVFGVNAGVTLSLNRVTVAKGYMDGYGGNPYGAGVYSSGGRLSINNSTFSGNYTLYGSGIYVSNGSVQVSNSSFSSNSSLNTLSNLGKGGGIYLDGGTLDVANSTFSGNGGGGNGGGVYIAGGTATLSNSTFSRNTAQQGGAIYSAGATATLTLVNTTVSDNFGLGTNGGGIYTAGGTLTVSNSTFSGNETTASGGGIYAVGGQLAVRNSTFSGNSGLLYGGGISIETGLLTVTNSTFYGNSAGRGGASFDNGGTTRLQNTITAKGTGGAECRGFFVDDGGNLSYPDATCPGANSDPLLGPLQNNGGPTLTMALGTGSPAIDGGSNTNCPATDQRGVSRPQDGNGDGTTVCDIGAVEQQPPSAPPPLAHLVDIDVKPGSDPNVINCRNPNGVIAVGILTTPAFDATTVDDKTVRFEGAAETHMNQKSGEATRSVEDIDDDGDLDLVLHFRLDETHLTCASRVAILWGGTAAGQPLMGVDFVRMVRGGAEVRASR